MRFPLVEGIKLCKVKGKALGYPKVQIPLPGWTCTSRASSGRVLKLQHLYFLLCVMGVK